MEKCPKCQSPDILYNQNLKVGDQKVTIVQKQLLVPVFVDVCRVCGYIEAHINELGLQTINKQNNE